MRLQLTAVAIATLAAVSAAGIHSAGSAPGPRRPAALVVQTSAEMAAYSDTDHVNVASPGISSTVSDEVAGWSIGGRYMLDAVTAASVDIVSTASSRWSEKRHVGSGAASYKRGAVGATVSGGVSREPDYLSFGAGAAVTVDLLDKNLTPFLGLSYGHDDVGRTGLDRSRWQLLQKAGLQAGATFVVNRSTIASVQLDVDLERGYLAKPYRYVPLFAPGAGGSNVPAGASVALVNQLRQDERPLEQLPRARDRFALTGRIAHRLGRATLRADERVYTDDWGLRASTTDVRTMFDLGQRLILWPHLRFHAQNAVRFWQRAYEVVAQPDGSVGLPRYRTGDRELSWLSTVTVGVGAKLRLSATVHAPWFLSFQLDAARTRYPDALFITRRTSIFSALSLEAAWN